MCKTTVGCLREGPKLGKWREKFGSEGNKHGKMEKGGDKTSHLSTMLISTFVWPSPVPYHHSDIKITSFIKLIKLYSYFLCDLALYYEYRYMHDSLVNFKVDQLVCRSQT